MAHDKRKITPEEREAARRLRVRRNALGMSQEALAEALGITFQQVQKYENGINRISIGRLFQISKVLDAPIAFFLGDDRTAMDVERAIMRMPAQESRPDVLRLLHAFMAIDDSRTRLHLVGTAQALARQNEKRKAA